MGSSEFDRSGSEKHHQECETGWLFQQTLKNRYPTNADIAGRRGSARLGLTEWGMADKARVIRMQRWKLVFRHEPIPGPDRLGLGQR